LAGVSGEESGARFWLLANVICSLFTWLRWHTGWSTYPHQLPHQAASNVARNNADMHTVKRILGHASVATTERYVT
jgi:integrase